MAIDFHQVISRLRQTRSQATLFAVTSAMALTLGAGVAYGDTKYLAAALAALVLGFAALTAPRHLTLLAIPAMVLVPPTVRIPSLGAGLTPLRLIVAVSIIGWLANGPRTIRMPSAYRFFGTVFSVYVLLLASTYSFSSVTRGVGYSIESLAIAWLAWRSIRDRRDLFGLVDLLMVVMIVAALLAVYETIVGHFLLPADEPLFFHAPFRDGQIRAQGVFPHPLVLGAALAVMLPVSISRSLSTAGWRRLLSASAALLYALTLILISGRGPWIGAAVAVVALAALTQGSRRRTILTAILVCAAAVAVSPLEGRVETLLKSVVSNETGQETVKSVRYRKTLLTASLSYAKGHPFGTGPGREEAAHLTGSLEAGTHLTDSIDNAYAKYAVELGPVGLLLFIFLIGSVANCVWRARKVQDKELGLLASGILAGEIAMLVVSATVATFSWQQLAALYWLLIGSSMMLRPLARPASQLMPTTTRHLEGAMGPTANTACMQRSASI
jgi:O-Antigen ligase